MELSKSEIETYQKWLNTIGRWSEEIFIKNYAFRPDLGDRYYQWYNSLSVNNINP